MVKKFKNILVPLDQSEQSSNVIKCGNDIAVRYRADLTLLNVIPSDARYEIRDDNRILPSHPFDTESVKVDYLQAYRWLESLLPKTLEKSINVQVRVLVATESVAVEIVHYAEQNSIDFIVMGTRGKTGVKRMLLGSVALHVITYAHCPVLVIR